MRAMAVTRGELACSMGGSHTDSRLESHLNARKNAPHIGKDLPKRKESSACMHACMHACTHAPMHACIHARTHADLGQKCWGGPLIGYLVGCLYLKVGVRFGICASESNGLNHIKFLANKTAGFDDCNLPTAGFEDCKLPTGPSLQP